MSLSADESENKLISIKKEKPLINVRGVSLFCETENK